VGFGVGFTVGFGAGVAVAAVMTTLAGDTDRRVTDREPAPEPLCAENTYVHVPAGSRRETENVTPEV
jgi:hypothetical protein